LLRPAAQHPAAAPAAFRLGSKTFGALPRAEALGIVRELAANNAIDDVHDCHRLSREHLQGATGAAARPQPVVALGRRRLELGLSGVEVGNPRLAERRLDQLVLLLRRVVFASGMQRARP
jgi:hypothetical protein